MSVANRNAMENGMLARMFEIKVGTVSKASRGFANITCKMMYCQRWLAESVNRTHSFSREMSAEEIEAGSRPFIPYRKIIDQSNYGGYD